MLATATSATCSMSRACSPSPSMVTGLPASMRLAKIVDVRAAKHRVLKAVCPVESAEVLLECKLARAVRRERAGRMVLVCQHHIGLSIKGAATRDEDELPDPGGDARLQHVEAADDVDRRVEAWVRNRLRYLGLRRMVVDDLGPECGDRGGHAFLVPDVEPQDLGLAIDAGLAAGAEVVEDCDLMTGGDVGVGHVRADETSAASDENLHRG